MQFRVEPEQMVKISRWQEEINQKNLAKQKASMSPEEFDSLTSGGKYAYTGAIGGSLTYSFTHTSLGTILKVTDGLSGESLDVSDYENW